MKNAVISFLKFEQVHNKKQSNMKAMAVEVNTCLNRSGLSRNDQYFVRKLRTDNADKMNVGEKNMIEQRRSNWTTFSNLNVWFNTWKEILVELGFGRKK